MASRSGTLWPLKLLLLLLLPLLKAVTLLSQQILPLLLLVSFNSSKRSRDRLQQVLMPVLSRSC
jgi:hypothetical protein